MMTVMFAAMQNGTVPAPMGAAPPPAGSYPYLHSFEEWVSLGSGTPGTGGSSVGGGGLGGSAPASRSPVTPVWRGGGGLGGAGGLGGDAEASGGGGDDPSVL